MSRFTQKKSLIRKDMGKDGSTQDAAAAIAFLALDEARFITGQVLCVDGGCVIG